jgi:hypothetical protein
MPSLRCGTWNGSGRPSGRWPFLRRNRHRHHQDARCRRQGRRVVTQGKRRDRTLAWRKRRCGLRACAGASPKASGLTALAPAIIEAILDGQEPDGPSLKSLRRSIPLYWDDQRVDLGASHAL